MKSKGATQSTTSTTESSPWEPAQDQLKSILSDAQTQYEKTGGIDSEWIEKNYPDLTDDMKSALTNMASSGNLQKVADQVNSITSSADTNVNSASGTLSNLSNSGVTSSQINDMAGQLYDNDTVKSQTAQLSKNVNDSYNQQVNQLNQQATSSGNMGSSRAGVAQGVMAGRANDALATGTAEIQNSARTNAYSQAASTLQSNQASNLSAANSLGQLGLSQGQLATTNTANYQQQLENQYGSANVGQTQAQNTALNDYYNAYGASQNGYTNLNNYLGVVGAIGSTGGTTTSTGTSTSSGGGNSMFQNILGGASTGAGVASAGAQAGWWSDASMKKKVKKTGETSDGTSTYDWEWNESGKKKGMKGKGSGVLAQQVAKDKPEAVARDKKTGALSVDYKKVGVKPKNSKKRKNK